MPTNAVLVQDCQSLAAATPSFRLSLAQTMDDLVACQRLRYLVFNCELGEGLADSDHSGLDRDPFDLICDHLMVHDAATNHLVGTYRMQTGYRAKGNLGYYSEQLFDLAPFEPLRGEILELGRACVRQDYRHTTALFMLWKGIASYAALCNARYMIGCSSITSQDEGEGIGLYRDLKERYLVEPSLQIAPKPGFECRGITSVANQHIASTCPRPPRLFRAYLDLSARLCGPPAIDREFRTIDFLTLLDLQSIPSRLRTRFFRQ
jgi:putative hemolysin